jgi:hypothetical protein
MSRTGNVEASFPGGLFYWSERCFFPWKTSHLPSFKARPQKGDGFLVVTPDLYGGEGVEHGAHGGHGKLSGMEAPPPNLSLPEHIDGFQGSDGRGHREAHNGGRRSVYLSRLWEYGFFLITSLNYCTTSEAFGKAFCIG